MARNSSVQRDLQRYRQKRDFESTSEPRGSRAVAPSEHLRFVIQKHDATRLHYDLRLELDGVFRSWAVTKAPSLNPTDKRLAVEVEDHPLDYGDFEGTIPEGEYGGGTVQLWDRGFWQPTGERSPQEALRQGHLTFIVAGRHLQGGYALVRMQHNRGRDTRKNWLLIKQRDTYARPEATQALMAQDRSVASGRGLAQIARGRGKAPVPFMLAKQIRQPPDAVWHSKPAAPGRAATSATRASERQQSPTVMGVRLSKPDKIFWPDANDGIPVSKLDLARYYETIGEWLMPHLSHRPCSFVRAPDGIAGQRFFQRHQMPGVSPLFSRVKVSGDREPYVQIDRIEALAAAAQLGVLELHPWNCGLDAPGVAGRLVFDLDPAPDVGFGQVIAAALDVRERLQAIGLESFCKTTGGKGLHVVSPLTGGRHAVEWPAAKNFAHIVCAQMALDSPGKYLDVMSKTQRTGRIFLDYLRNDRTATAVAVLSSRAREGATVSMPLDWKQIKSGLDPMRYTLRSAPSLLKKTRPWQDYADSARPLDEAIERLAGKSAGRPAAIARQRSKPGRGRTTPRKRAAKGAPQIDAARRAHKRP